MRGSSSKRCTAPTREHRFQNLHGMLVKVTKIMSKRRKNRNPQSAKVKLHTLQHLLRVTKPVFSSETWKSRSRLHAVLVFLDMRTALRREHKNARKGRLSKKCTACKRERDFWKVKSCFAYLTALSEGQKTGFGRKIVLSCKRCARYWRNVQGV